MGLTDNLFELEDTSINATTAELEDIYQESFPYSYVNTVNGSCIIWDDNFIENAIFAMSTDKLSQMSPIELQAWYQFVEFEDGASSSANTDAGVIDPIGCTIPDASGKSYIVSASSGTTNVLCDEPLESVNKENISKSFDTVLVNILNCLPFNDCGTKDVEDENGDGKIDYYDLDVVYGCSVTI